MKTKKPQTLEKILERASSAMMMAGDTTEVTIHSRDVGGDTPLHKAALWGDRQAILTLVEAGAEIDAKGDLGCTPLYYAVMYNHVLAAEQLLMLGARPDIVSELAYSPKSLAMHENNKEMIALFRESYATKRR